MAIGTIFQFGNQIVEVRVDGFNCLFRTQDYGGGLVPIDSLKLDKKGSIKEHPDLKDNEDWREETIKRFKEKIKQEETEMARMKYIIKDLKKHGYEAMYMERQGFRPIKLKQ